MSVFVVVNNNRAQLRNSSGPLCSFCDGATSAVIQGNKVVVTTKDRTYIYEINNSQTNVNGPVKIIL